MLRVLLRFVCYAALMAIIAFGLLQSALYWPGGLLIHFVVDEGSTLGTSEFSPVEYLQNLLLIISTAVFVWIAIRDRLRRPLAVGFIAMFTIDFIRELDYFLDRFVDNLWQVLCVIILAFATVYIYRHRKRFVMGWQRSWPSAGLAIIFSGLMLAPFTQIASNESLWQAIMGTDYVRVAKLAAEELMELGAYLLIMVGSLEFLYTWSRLPDTRTMDPGRRSRKRKRRKR